MEKQFNFEFLNSIRGLSAISVLYTHSIGESSFYHGQYFGVIEFFLMSAFLLTLHMLTRSEKSDDFIGFLNQLCNYVVMRFFRIYVPFVIFCALATQISYEKFLNNNGNLPLKAFVSLDFNTNKQHTYLWTIPVEIKYYLIIPLIVYVAHKFRVNFKLACVIHAVLVGTVCFFICFKLKFGKPTSFWTALPTFLIGSSMAILYKTLVESQVNLKINSYKLLSMSISIVSGLMFIIGVRIHVWCEDYSIYIYSIYWSAHMLLMLIGAPNQFTTLLSNIKFLKIVGKYSYGFYLFHGLSMQLFGIISTKWSFLNMGLIKVLILNAQALLMGCVYYELVETNCIKLAKKINSYTSVFSKRNTTANIQNV